jgi:hypothetical protein
MTDFTIFSDTPVFLIGFAELFSMRPPSTSQTGWVGGRIASGLNQLRSFTVENQMNIFLRDVGYGLESWILDFLDKEQLYNLAGP